MCVEEIQLSLVECRGTHDGDEVSLNCHGVAKDCFVEVVGRWLSHEDGTGDSPRTWETVFTKKKLLSLLKGKTSALSSVMLWLVHICTYVYTHTSMTSTDICMACYIVHMYSD